MKKQSTSRPLPQIFSGFQTGSLTVTGATTQRKNGYTVWLCRCSCGNEILLDTRYLQRGTITDCGCISGIRPLRERREGTLTPGQKDLTGRSFGRLTCLSPTTQRGKNGAALWNCLCSCGNTRTALSTQLLSGNKKSCGCLSHPAKKDFSGKRFGNLTVTEYAHKRNGMHYWKCRCDCGAQALVGQSLLQSGKTRSCGCLQASCLLKNRKLCTGTSVAQLEAGKKRRISSNTSGYTGVYRHKASGKWIAQITFQGKTRYLGSYKQLGDAIAARQRGEEIHDRFLEWYYSRQVNSSGDPPEFPGAETSSQK